MQGRKPQATHPTDWSQKMKNLIAKWHALSQDESGATAIEYGLLAGLIAVAIVAGATALGTELNTLFTDIANSLPAIP